MKTVIASLALLVVFTGPVAAQQRPALDQIVGAVKQLSPHVAAQAEREQLGGMLGRLLREQIDAANKASSADWAAIATGEDWERFRREKLDRLRASLGALPPRLEKPRMLVTRRIQGEGFQIHNVVYGSRSGLVVTANLYVPDPPRASMPGIVISHSHHNPKEQGELQDMGMTWARAGCYVLVPDHLGHGERRQHPFASAADYPAPFQAGRQDYYFRYDTSLQLYLVGQTLMGWMAHDLMTGVDVLLAQPGIDHRRIILLGSVAGGGDPAAVTAALDERIACVCPFNFGGPQPETRYPLPDDAEISFNYAGGGSWESTRNLYRSAADGFLPWVIVGSTAPRHLIHAHEFAWDGERDPVWKRYQKIWRLHDAADRLSVAHGFGTLTGQNPPGSHCNNIGAVHRRSIHDAFRRWFQIDVRPEDEYSRRLAREELTCLTDEARREFQPRKLHEILAGLAADHVAAARSLRATLRGDERRLRLREIWARLLGNVEPPKELTLREGSPPREEVGGVTVRRQLLETEPGAVVPLMMLALKDPGGQGPRRSILFAADDGIAGLLRRQDKRIAEALQSGATIALAEVRGTGAASPNPDRGPQSAATSRSATCLMLGQPLLGGQLRDLRAVCRHLRTQAGNGTHTLAVLGDSGIQPLAADASFAYPWRIPGRPPEIQPTGALLALLLALFEDDVQSVDAQGGLVSYQSVLESPFVQVPHACVVPGVLLEGDLPDLVAALVPREVRLSRLVDGRGRLVSQSAARAAYEIALSAYAAANAPSALVLAELAGERK